MLRKILRTKDEKNPFFHINFRHKLKKLNELIDINYNNNNKQTMVTNAHRRPSHRNSVPSCGHLLQMLHGTLHITPSSTGGH